MRPSIKGKDVGFFHTAPVGRNRLAVVVLGRWANLDRRTCSSIQAGFGHEVFFETH